MLSWDRSCDETVTLCILVVWSSRSLFTKSSLHEHSLYWSFHSWVYPQIACFWLQGKQKAFFKPSCMIFLIRSELPKVRRSFFLLEWHVHFTLHDLNILYQGIWVFEIVTIINDWWIHWKHNFCIIGMVIF